MALPEELTDWLKSPLRSKAVGMVTSCSPLGRTSPISSAEGEEGEQSALGGVDVRYVEPAGPCGIAAEGGDPILLYGKGLLWLLK